jgi:hypothetical protein
MPFLNRVRDKVRKFFNRLYSDFMMPSRLPEYELLLQKALEQGYETYSVFSFWQHIKKDGLNHKQKYLILRHDIDTDIETAKEIWKIEQRLGVEASYYFRLSTLDVSFMQSIHQSGSEASYHYEELASYCKQYKLKDPVDVNIHMDDIRKQFKENYLSLKDLTGLPLKTVASHGDFVNRKLGMTNVEILKNNRLREELGIVCEVYDPSLMKNVTKRYSDTLAPDYWKPYHPFKSFNTKEPVVYILTHPRHWRKRIRENAVENFRRVWEGIRYHSKF